MRDDIADEESKLIFNATAPRFNSYTFIYKDKVVLNSNFLFKIRAINRFGASDFSEEVKLTAAIPPRVIGPVTSTLTNGGLDMKISWKTAF
jgi:hypothetical protein